MKNLIYIIAISVITITSAVAQQLPYTSQLNDNRALWNPAATAYGTHMVTNVHMRQQWIGFDGAPRTGSLMAEYPLLDYNMSGGAALTFDKTGPVSKIGLQLNYAYKLQNIFTRDGQLSAGISAGFTQYAFDPSNAVVNDTEDPLANGGRATTFFPSVTAGVFYISNPKKFDGGNVFFTGLSYSQVYAGDVLANSADQERYNHVFFEIGTRIQNRDSYFEPSLMFNYTNPDLSNMILTGKYEMKDAFWAGLGYSSASDISIQGGYILPEIGSRYDELRFGILANYGISDTATQFGLGVEAIVTYAYNLD